MDLDVDDGGGAVRHLGRGLAGILLVAAVSACGADARTTVASKAAPAAERAEPTGTDDAPISLLAFSDYCCWDSFSPPPADAAALRDQVAVVVAGTVVDVRLGTSAGADSFLQPGQVHVDVRVDEIVGGRSLPVRGPNAKDARTITLLLRTETARAGEATMIEALRTLIGSRHLLFLSTAVSWSTGEDLPYYEPGLVFPTVLSLRNGRLAVPAEGYALDERLLPRPVSSLRADDFPTTAAAEAGPVAELVGQPLDAAVARLKAPVLEDVPSVPGHQPIDPIDP